MNPSDGVAHCVIGMGDGRGFQKSKAGENWVIVFPLWRIKRKA